MVGRLLATREDVFDGYRIEGFREAFGTRFAIVDEVPTPGSQRLLFRMARRR